MTRKHILMPGLLAATTLLGSPSVQAQEDRQTEPPKAQAQADASELIEQLGDDSYRVRKAAERALTELGAKARAELEEAADDHDDAEVRWRARRVLERMDRGDRGGLRRRDSADGERGGREVGGQPGATDVDERLESMIERMERMFQREPFGGGDPFRGQFRDLHRQMDELRRRMERMDRGFGTRFSFPGGALESSGGSQSLKVEIGPQGVRVEVQEKDADGKTETKVYEAPDQGAFREKYPDVAEKYLGRGRGFDFRGFGMDDLNELRSRIGQPLRPLDRGAPVPPQIDPRQVVPPEIAQPQIAPPPGRRLGVFVDELNAEVGEFLGLDAGQGLVVRSVQEGSLAESLGLREGDVIVEVAGRKIHSTADVAEALGGIDAGESVEVAVNRRGATVTLDAEKRESGAAKKLQKRDSKERRGK